ncbi:MAG: tetratricopeptide repeat protein [Bacteroidales bacterium]|jgi:tetratricopeptide (TPR) repeat protein|nr:tetratricopeptide repeat protein [Bacteroidales bacterium]MBR4817497.1 tetratricopeptide repeat protein [Bacteroidales bacterium]
MKKIILTLAAVILSAGLISAQDMAQATETAQNANESLVAKDYAKALEGFKEALTLAQACGEEGEELANTCKSVIPSIVLSIAKNEIKEAKYDEGLAQLEEAIKAAEEFGNDDVIGEAATLIPQVKKQKAVALYNDKDYAAAAEAFKEVLAADPEDGASALRLAMALTNTGDKEGSIEAFKQAAANGQEANANKQLANIFLKDAQQLLKDKKYKEAIAACEESNTYVESANAYKLAASAASQLKDNAKAIGFYEKYLAVSPDAKDANGIITTLAVLYQQSGNKAKAIEYYTKVQNDPQYGATAKQQLEALKK